MHIRQILFFLIVICLLIDVLSMVEIFARNGYFVQAAIGQRFRIWTWLMYFCLGYYLGVIPRGKRFNMYVVIGTAITSVAVVCFQVFLCKEYLERINSEYLYDNFLLIAWASMIFMTFLDWNKELKKPIRSFCRNSFGVFLLHEFFLEGLSLTEKVSGAIQPAGLLLGLIAVCWSLTSLIKSVLKKTPYPFSKLLDY